MQVGNDIGGGFRDPMRKQDGTGRTEPAPTITAPQVTEPGGPRSPSA
jgi:hypothetical protein